MFAISRYAAAYHLSKSLPTRVRHTSITSRSAKLTALCCGLSIGRWRPASGSGILQCDAAKNTSDKTMVGIIDAVGRQYVW